MRRPLNTTEQYSYCFVTRIRNSLTVYLLILNLILYNVPYLFNAGVYNYLD